MDDDRLTVAEAARLAGITVGRVRQLLHEHPAWGVQDARLHNRWWVYRAPWLAWIAARDARPAGGRPPIDKPPPP